MSNEDIPQTRRACGKCKREVGPEEPVSTALLGTVTDDAKHWTVEMFVCGDCTPAVATQGSNNATGLRTAIEDLKRRCEHGRLLADWCIFCIREKDAP